MPDKKEHLAVARRNQEVIDYLLQSPTDFSEWVATVAFYKALHLVEALFAHDKVGHGTSHTSREWILKTTRRYSKIYSHYRPLWAASMVARYLQDDVAFSSHLSPEKVRSELLNYRLSEIAKSVSKLIHSPPGQDG